MEKLCPDGQLAVVASLQSISPVSERCPVHDVFCFWKLATLFVEGLVWHFGVGDDGTKE